MRKNHGGIGDPHYLSTDHMNKYYNKGPAREGRPTA